jgi:hypothetical protein
VPSVLAPRKVPVVSNTPVIHHFPGCPKTSHCFFFLSDSMSPAKMSSNQVAAIPPFVSQVKKLVEDHLDTDPSGSIAGEEEYRDWGKEFLKRMVRRFFFLFPEFVDYLPLDIS